MWTAQPLCGQPLAGQSRHRTGLVSAPPTISTIGAASKGFRPHHLPVGQAGQQKEGARTAGARVPHKPARLYS